MSKHIVKKGRTSYMVDILILDSTSAVGAGKTGLAAGASPDLAPACYRARADDGNAAGTQLALTAGTRGTWSSGGFKEKDATNMPGIYELGLDDAGLATGSDWVIYYLQGATGMAPCVLEIQLVPWDPQDSTRLGLTAILNEAASDARIQKNTAYSNFMFRMTDSTDHVSPKTGLTVTAQRSLDGAAFGACANAVSEVASGWYK